MKRRRRIEPKESGLVLGLLLGKYFLGTEHLHFGYWTDGLEVAVANLKRAQDDYCELLLSHLPPGVRSILDVGCGSGALPALLVDRGYAVDCVSPSSLLTRYVERRLGDRCRTFECRLEELETDRRYDLVLFSESYQYVDLEAGLERAVGLLGAGGHLLICDYFRTAPAAKKSYLGGGHDLARFREAIARRPLRPLADLDITAATAPTLAVADGFLAEVAEPLWALILEVLESHRPRLFRFLAWRYRRRIDRLHARYFSDPDTPAFFKATRSYRLLLYEKR